MAKSLVTTCRWLSRLVTPGADHAARSTSSSSAHERSVPCSTTLPPTVSTRTRSASTVALRWRAASIFFSTSLGTTLGRTVRRLERPTTPVRCRTALPAWVTSYCQSTSPSRVTHPSRTVTWTRSFGTHTSQLSVRTAASAISVSGRCMWGESRTSRSFATPLTPWTRLAARSAASRCG